MMAAQTAQIIDFEERRRMRRAEMIQDRAAAHAHEQPFLQPALQPAMMFVPVWFAPVFFIGNPAGQG